MGLNGYELIEYACSRFEEGKYEEALDAFVLAYSKGTEQEWILENIYNCYMQGNEQEFEETFHKWKDHTSISYEQCSLDFVPYSEGKYFIYDKEEYKFRGIFSIDEFENVPEGLYKQLEFSGFAVAMGWDWLACNSILVEAKNRKLYVISNDICRMSSFFKLPELQTYANNIKIFSDLHEFQEYFHQHTAIYLPHVVVGTEEEKKYLAQVIEEEHQYRLTPEGRNTDNVLLTIGIPTHARGNLLLKRLEHLKTMPYDAEIEFAVSKNGSVLYEEEYAQVGKMEDSRINYFDHRKELRHEENWHYLVEMSHGKYVLFVSDEDDVNIESLEHYLSLLNNCSDTAVIRANGTTVYNDIKESKYCTKGEEAFQGVFLRQNYISGLIVRRELFLQQNFRELKQYTRNAYYASYAHDWWCTWLSVKGNYIEDPCRLFVEGKSVLEEEVKAYEKLGLMNRHDMFSDNQLPWYATYEERFLQFDGQKEFLHLITEEHSELVIPGILRLINKITILITIARNYGYKTEKYADAIIKFMNVSMNLMDEFLLSANEKELILNQITKNVAHLMDYHHQSCERERKGELYYRRGVEFFEHEKYEQAIENWISAFELGYYREVIVERLYQRLLIPYVRDFQKNYERNNQGFSNIRFEDCVLDFIPVSDKKYYIYDKAQGMFQGAFCLEETGLHEPPEAENGRFYTDVWDIRQIVCDKERLSSGIIYVILENMESRFVSFFKLPRFRELYLEKINLFHTRSEFQTFLEENNERYLPESMVSANLLVYNQIIQDIRKQKRLSVCSAACQDQLDVIKKAGQKNLLILKGRSQYGAMRRMADDLAAAMRSIGYNTLLIDTTDDLFEQNIYTAKEILEFEAVIALNGVAIGFDYVRNLGKKSCILLGDHPSWHINRLMCGDDNTIVNCWDHNDVAFIKRFYPNVGKAVCLYGSSTFLGEEHVFSDRQYDLVFTGGYSDPKQMYDQMIQIFDGALLLFVKDFINKLIAHPNMTYEDALWETLRDHGQNDIFDEEFREWAAELCDVNTFIRAYYRDKIIRKIVENGITIHVSGNGWEDFQTEYKENLVIENNDWYTAKKLIANAKISLNIMPWFKNGFHDRAVTSMLSGSVLLTDASRFIETNFQDMEDMAIYHLEDLEELPNKITYLLSHPKEAEKIAEKGKGIALQRFTWEARAKCMVNDWFGDDGTGKQYAEVGTDLSIMMRKAGRFRSAKNYLAELEEIDQVAGFFEKGSTSKLIGASDYRYIVKRLKVLVEQLRLDYPEIQVGSYVWRQTENLCDPIPEEIPELLKMEIGYLFKALSKETS